MVEAVLVMLNNYFHDLAVAFLFASTLLAHVVLRYWPGRPSQDVAKVLTRVAWGSLAWVLLGGIVRVIFYREYEWLPKAGTAPDPGLDGKARRARRIDLLGPARCSTFESSPGQCRRRGWRT